MATECVSCYLTLHYSDGGDAAEGYRLLSEAGVEEGIDMLVMPPLFTMRVIDMSCDQLGTLVTALEGTGAKVSQEPDKGPLVWHADE